MLDTVIGNLTYVILTDIKCHRGGEGDMNFLTTIFAAVTEFADAFAALTQSYGALGVVFFVIIFIAVVLFFLPITPFSLAAGAIYGWWGIPIAYTGAVLGAMIAFWIARGAGHKHVRRLCQKRPIARAIVQVMVKGGFRLILLVRLSGLLPFAVQNYSFGFTAVNWHAYLSASMIGLVPGAVIKVWIGKVGMDVLHGGNTLADRVQTFSLIIAVVLTLIMVAYIGLLAVRELKKEGVLGH